MLRRHVQWKHETLVVWLGLQFSVSVIRVEDITVIFIATRSVTFDLSILVLQMLRCEPMDFQLIDWLSLWLEATSIA